MPPDHAVSLWLDSRRNVLCLQCPSPSGTQLTLEIPLHKCQVLASAQGAALAEQSGWAALLRTLQARADNTTTPSTLGTASAPTQYDLDTLLRHAKRYDTSGNRTSLSAEEFFGPESEPSP